MAWEDNFNSIYAEDIPVDDTFTWKFRLEEHKKRGTLHVSVRLFKKTETYDGPTKNGFNLQVNSVEELDKLQEAFIKLFEATKEKL